MWILFCQVRKLKNQQYILQNQNYLLGLYPDEFLIFWHCKEYSSQISAKNEKYSFTLSKENKEESIMQLFFLTCSFLRVFALFKTLCDIMDFFFKITIKIYFCINIRGKKMEWVL